MCAGSLLANRELYLVYMRLISSFQIKMYDDVDCHPIRGNADPTSLVALPKRYRVLFVPRDGEALDNALTWRKEQKGMKQAHGVLSVKVSMVTMRKKPLLRND